jgi:exopolyphosphatase/guanosine-5'-triphosphate,3'-diphosphate pyrophosphatase
MIEKKCETSIMAEEFPLKAGAKVPGAGGAGGHEREPDDPRGSPDQPEASLPGGRSDNAPQGTIAQPRDEADFRRAAFHRQSYAAIDLGTNNCRLLIARPSGENFVVIDAFSRVVRLGEGLAQTGRLSQEAMDRTLAALRVCADKLVRRNVYLARSVATEACRRAVNGAEFIDRVRQETGIALDIISAREEARLAVLGCHVLLETGLGPAMIFDIGGGSTELVLIESTETVPRILDWQSVPWGVVSLTESCGAEGPDAAARKARYTRMREMVSDSFASFAERASLARAEAASRGPLRLLGTSGTVTTLASLHLDLPQYDRRAVDGLIVPTASMRAISTRLSTMALADRRELPCIGRERADLVVSDMAANTVGHKQTDHLRTMGLVETAADFAIAALAPGGAFVAKVLAGGTDATLLALLKRHFASVKHAKPPASRKDSSEWYVIAQGFKGRE